jgi:hypothetical protein
MAETRKVLSQTNPSAATLTDSYTVPASTQAIVSSLIVSNNSAVGTSFRVSVAVAGAADDPKQYIYYDIAIAGNDTFVATLGLTLGAADKIRVYATLATLVFNVFGVELT